MNAHPNSTWKDLYHAAIHESDLNKLPERITDAEIALVLCARELFYTSDYRIGEEEIWTKPCASSMRCVAL